MSSITLLQDRRLELRDAIRESLGGPPHIDAFAVRLLGMPTIHRIAPCFRLEPQIDASALRYGGFPQIACLGFASAIDDLPYEAGNEFVDGIRSLRSRPRRSRNDFMSDDIAVLGVAEGLARVPKGSQPGLEDLCEWVSGVADQRPTGEQWPVRLRALAADILDGRGRLRTTATGDNPDSMGLEIALHCAYPHMFVSTPTPSEDELGKLLRSLISDPAPSLGELDRAAVWLAAVDNLVDLASGSLLPTTSDCVRLLSSVQHALKRWPWEEHSRRKNTMPTRWLIDNEYHVQALLWTLLYPVYGAELVDEEYLPSWGNVQPRVDLGIRKLKLIIEVKIARTPSDYKKIEEQVAGDLGLYFRNTNQFDHMVVFIYDDCDSYQPERYDGLRNALSQRERIEDVVIVRRPSMIPNQSCRG